MKILDLLVEIFLNAFHHKFFPFFSGRFLLAFIRICIQEIWNVFNAPPFGDGDRVDVEAG